MISKELLFILTISAGLIAAPIAFFVRRYFPDSPTPLLWLARILIVVILFASFFVAVVLSVGSFSSKVIDENYPGISGYLSVFPGAVLYNYLFWRFLSDEVDPAKSSFFIWISEKNFLANIIGLFLSIRFVESTLSLFEIASGVSGFILSVGVPIALFIGILKIAREDIEDFEREDHLDEPFQTVVPKIDPVEIIDGEKIVYFFDPESRLCQEIDREVSKEKEIQSFNVREYIDFDWKVDKTPTIVGFINGVEVARISGAYSKSKLAKMMTHLKREMNIARLSQSFDSEK